MIFSLLLFFSAAQAKELGVLMIDSGVNKYYLNKLCKTGHKSFVEGEPWDKDIEVKHGTNVASLIEKSANSDNYCITVYKVFSSELNSNADLTVSALEKASAGSFDVINISISGTGYVKKEHMAIKKLLDSGTVVVVSAGNNSMNLDKGCNVYPACYDSRLIVVGSINKNGDISEYSNRSRLIKNFVYVREWDVEAGGVKLIGTSQSTAILTGGLIRYILKNNILVRKPQSFSRSDLEKIGKAVSIQTGLNKYVSEFLKSLQQAVPEEIKLVGGFVIPVYKTYSSGLFTIEKRF